MGFMYSDNPQKAPKHDAEPFRRDDAICNAPSAGWSDEPSYTSPSGIPLCERCGKSTRSVNRLVCRPCESGTRLVLTKADRRWLRHIGVVP